MDGVQLDVIGKLRPETDDKGKGGLEEVAAH